MRAKYRALKPRLAHIREAWVLEWPKGSICQPMMGVNPKLSFRNWCPTVVWSIMAT